MMSPHVYNLLSQLDSHCISWQFHDFESLKQSSQESKEADGKEIYFVFKT